MQLTRDSSGVNFIRAWETGRVRIAERWIAGNVIVGSDRILEAWTAVEPHALTIEHLEPALALEPTIIVLGTGTERLLPDVELMAAVAARSVGLEIMSTPAACRTFNVLLSEQRRVVAALFNPAQ
ncbi:MAG TPA: MTH938/NDUFAF3 family protein [Gammaproteobacteria bacterium]